MSVSPSCLQTRTLSTLASPWLNVEQLSSQLALGLPHPWTCHGPWVVETPQGWEFAGAKCPPAHRASICDPLKGVLGLCPWTWGRGWGRWSKSQANKDLTPEMSRILGAGLSGKSECQLVKDGLSEAYPCPNVAKDLKFEGVWLAQSAKQLSSS